MSSILALNIVDGTVIIICSALSAAALGYLLVRRASPGRENARRAVRRPGRRWAMTVLAGAGAGAVLAVVILVLCEVVFNVFGLPLDPDTRAWVIGAFAAVGVAVVNLWNSRWWRKAIAAVAILLFAATATLGINAGYGLNLTLGSLLNLNTGQALAVPRPVNSPTSSPSTPPQPLWQTWKPPAGMPASGQLGTVKIPNTASGFAARPAYLYLPPAALVPNPPALPVLVMMMGQPGGPESSALFVPTLNAMAAANRGLGPIVLTIDQIGSPTKNPLCIDSPAGRVHTYVMTDVVNFIRTNLHVATGRQYWAVGGYSNGGECALSFGAKHPDVFGSILDISGEIGPSLGSPSATLRLGFGGNKAAYDAEQPLNIMKATHYTDMLAIFTSGSKDTVYTPQGAAAEAAAKAAGMTTARFIGPGVGHRADAILFGLPKGLPLLYRRWDLEAPAP
ncbi:alpha/beta hydrolase [Lacisediminihabitans sp.]|uniref:alpha/beta hydrolase n=1 Tax=Lacisediminihabitans sp. TaxID=2787631 RepID=UPI00374DA723